MFETIKQRIQEIIERNAVVSELSWTDKHGNVHTEEVLLKRSKLPMIGDWSRIYPPINKNGKINFVNLIFGGWKNLYKLLFIMFILYSFWAILGESKKFMDGDKYIILEKEVFNKFCTTRLLNTGESITYAINYSALDSLKIPNEPK